ncbi:MULTISPECIES: heparan-alpha-glucosaminide N-acetyltransferase domain-containing protein [unclassified Streptomyces]|uniref:heparan-alpha-glucosaminide N-acetyltransferase domain-containing protein n=1 Tax=unclassified Streptomyces TaxID=2593676 RepID=UPI003369E955
MGRLVGVDLARALAVFGMYIVHIGPPLSATHGVASWIRYLPDGHSSVLFASLAGLSLMLIAGRREPKTGLAGRQAKARITIRAVVLLALGTVMAMEYGGVIILGFYGVYFLLALPLVRLRARTLAIIAAALALVTPQLAFALTSLLTEPIQQSINAYDPLRRLSEVGVLDLLLTGFYPALTWMSFVIAGMALGRLDLSSGTVQRRLAALGAALAVTAYGMSLLLAGKDALRSLAEDGPSSGSSGSLPLDKSRDRPVAAACGLLLGRFPQSPGLRDRSHRSVPHRYGLPAALVRAVLHQPRHPAGAHRRHHPTPDRPLDHPASTELPHGPRRPCRVDHVPHPESRGLLHRQLRRRLRGDRRARPSNTAPSTPDERHRGTLDRIMPT